MSAFYPDDTFEGIVAGFDRVYSLGSIVGSPTIANGVPYIGSADGNLYAIK